MLSGLEKLANMADEKSTVVIYFSGHGYQVKSSIGDFYYLMPFGYNIGRVNYPPMNWRACLYAKSREAYGWLTLHADYIVAR